MKIESISPIFSVSNLEESIAFYRGTLGFTLAWSWGEPADIASVCRDGVEITLTQRVGSKPVGAAHVYLGMSGIDEFYETLVATGVSIIVPLEDRPYGMRDFRIADPSGNELSIGQIIKNRGHA